MTETYTIDDADKLTRVTYANDTPTKTYAYHFSGRCTGITQNGVTKTLAWNKENRLTGITGGGLNNSYAYNGLNTRISKTDASGSFTYKRASAHQTSPVVFDGAANFLPSISEKRAGSSTFLHSGIKNGILQTNSSQTNTARNRYDAFGNSLATTGTWKGPFAYGGKFGYQTDSAELELLGDRYYDPTIGRFLSRDLAKDGRNWYGYSGANPVTNADPEGKFFFVAIVAVASVVALYKGAEKIADAGLEVSRFKTYDRELKNFELVYERNLPMWQDKIARGLRQVTEQDLEDWYRYEHRKIALRRTGKAAEIGFKIEAEVPGTPFPTL